MLAPSGASFEAASRRLRTRKGEAAWQLRLFYFLGRFRASKAPLERWRCLFAPDLSFLIVSGSSGILKQGKGWRRFDRGRLDAVCPNSAAASLTGGNRGTRRPMGVRPGPRGKRQGDRSDVRQEYVR